MTKPSEADEPLLTIEQAAKLMTASARTIRRRIQDGDLAVIRDGRIVRIRPEDLRRYISRHRIG
jgi:excisionase family DNA binding protein